MIITRETDYAVRILRALMSGEMRAMREVVAEQMIPRAFAYKILQKLVRAGFVEVMRGSAGGCRLAVSLDDVSVYDLICAIDGPSSVSACLDESFVCEYRNTHGDCHVRCCLVSVQALLDNELKSHSLASVIGDAS